MHSKKEYEVKIKKLERIISKLEKKVAQLAIAKKALNKEKCSLKQRVRELKQSRDNWKAKYKLKQEGIKQLQAKLSRKGKAKWHHYSTNIVCLCVLLRTRCGCSYGSCRKILSLLNSYFSLGLDKIPCENTIQNWVSKLGLYTLEQTAIYSIDEQVSLIIDESIRLGQEKLLLILSVPFIKLKQGALNFQDVQVVYMKGAISWTGKKIGEVVEELQKTHRFKVKNILSDEDSKLKNACKLLSVSHVPDISHAIATCLKKVFEKTEEFKSFKKLIASYSSRGVNQALSFLCPPKQRTKARFMSLHRVIKWANSMLENFGKLNKTQSDFFKDLRDQSSFIAILEECIGLAKEVSLPFKEQGLSKQTIEQAQNKIDILQKKEGCIRIFCQELQKYISHYQEIIGDSEELKIHSSSEIIESMFGKYKSKANNYALTGLTSLNLELPLYGRAMEKVSLNMEQALEEISIAKLIKWRENNSSDNQLVKRQKFFEN